MLKLVVSEEIVDDLDEELMMIVEGLFEEELLVAIEVT